MLDRSSLDVMLDANTHASLLKSNQEKMQVILFYQSRRGVNWKAINYLLKYAHIHLFFNTKSKELGKNNPSQQAHSIALANANFEPPEVKHNVSCLRRQNIKSRPQRQMVDGFRKCFRR